MSGLFSSFGTQLTISSFHESNPNPVTYGSDSRSAIPCCRASGSAAMWSIRIPLFPGDVFFFVLLIYCYISPSCIGAVNKSPYISPVIVSPSLFLQTLASSNTGLSSIGIFSMSSSVAVPSCILCRHAIPCSVSWNPANRAPFFIYQFSFYRKNEE